MTLGQAKRFYEQDLKKYQLENNEEFLTWLKKSIDEGYNCFLDLEQIQELINYISYWYEMKYPERELEKSDGIINLEFQDINKISDIMTIRQLLYRLPHDQLCLMECGYRAKGWGRKPIFQKGKETGHESIIFMEIGKKIIKPDKIEASYFLISANHYTGKVFLDQELGKYIDKELILDELLNVLSNNYKDELDLNKLKENVYNHNYDIELRKNF